MDVFEKKEGRKLQWVLTYRFAYKHSHMTAERSLNSGHVVSVCKQLINRGVIGPIVLKKLPEEKEVIGFRVCFMPAPIALKKLLKGTKLLCNFLGKD